MPMARVRMSGGAQTGPKCSKPLRSAMKATAAIAAQSAMPGAARLRLSGDHSRTSSTAKESLRIEDGDQLAFSDRFAFAHLDFLDHAGFGGKHRNFHFHRFEDHDFVFELNAVAGFELDFPDIAGDLRLHIHNGHEGAFSRISPASFFGHRMRQRKPRSPDPRFDPVSGGNLATPMASAWPIVPACPKNQTLSSRQSKIAPRCWFCSTRRTRTAG